MAAVAGAEPGEPRLAIPTALSPALLLDRRPEGEIGELAGVTMGTRWSAAVVLGRAAPGAKAAESAIIAAADAVVAAMSQWEPASELSQFNAAPPGRWQTLSPAFFAVLDHAIGIARASGGAFDPAAGALSELWGFGAAPFVGLPSAAAVTAAQEAGGWQRLEVDRYARRVRQPGGLRLDLAGIAKGYAVGAALAGLRAIGIGNALVEIGGELAGMGLRPDGQPWWVVLEDPPGAALAPIRVALAGLAVATSGDWRRAHAGGSHTIDPRNGRPIGNGIAAVSVIAESCMAADAWATALTVLGLEQGLALATDRGLAARFVRRTGAGYEERFTPAFAEMLA
jgi:FAD:protein FMN transferase